MKDRWPNWLPPWEFWSRAMGFLATTLTQDWPLSQTMSTQIFFTLESVVKLNGCITEEGFCTVNNWAMMEPRCTRLLQLICSFFKSLTFHEKFHRFLHLQLKSFKCTAHTTINLHHREKKELGPSWQMFFSVAGSVPASISPRMSDWRNPRIDSSVLPARRELRRKLSQVSVAWS